MADDGYGSASNELDDKSIPSCASQQQPRKVTTIYIPRDYSKGLTVKFERRYPEDLRGLVSEDEWFETIDNVNSLFDEAEKVCCGTILETLIGCATCYVVRVCGFTRYEKKLIEIRRYLDVRNAEVFLPAGLQIHDPMNRALRVLEINEAPTQ